MTFPSPLKFEERELLERTGELWNDFCKLDEHVESDSADFCSAIHTLQRIIAMRGMRRTGAPFRKHDE